MAEQEQRRDTVESVLSAEKQAELARFQAAIDALGPQIEELSGLASGLDPKNERYLILLRAQLHSIAFDGIRETSIRYPLHGIPEKYVALRTYLTELGLELDPNKPMGHLEDVIPALGLTTAETVESPAKQVVPSGTLPKVVVADEVTIITEEPVDTTLTHAEEWEALRLSAEAAKENGEETTADTFVLHAAQLKDMLDDMHPDARKELAMDYGVFPEALQPNGNIYQDLFPSRTSLDMAAAVYAWAQENNIPVDEADESAPSHYESYLQQAVLPLRAAQNLLEAAMISVSSDHQGILEHPFEDVDTDTAIANLPKEIVGETNEETVLTEERILSWKAKIEQAMIDMSLTETGSREIVRFLEQPATLPESPEQAEAPETKPITVMDGFELTRHDANIVLGWAREEADGENAGEIAKALGVPVEKLPDALQALSDDINPSQLKTMDVVRAFLRLQEAQSKEQPDEKSPVVEGFSSDEPFEKRNEQIMAVFDKFLREMNVDIHIESFTHGASQQKERKRAFDALAAARVARGVSDYYIIPSIVEDLNLSMASQLDELAKLRAQAQEQTQEPTRRTFAA